MQKLFLIGRLGRDAAVRECQDGSKMLSFTVAANGRYRGAEKTSWYDVSTFNVEKYKNMVKYLTKGSGVVVIGELDADIEEGSDGRTRCRRSVLADSIEFNGSGSGNGNGNSDNKVATSAPSSKKKEEDIPDDITDEELMRPAKKKTAAKTVEEEIDDMSDSDVEGDLPF